MPAAFGSSVWRASYRPRRRRGIRDVSCRNGSDDCGSIEDAVGIVAQVINEVPNAVVVRGAQRVALHAQPGSQQLVSFRRHALKPRGARHARRGYAAFLQDRGCCRSGALQPDGPLTRSRRDVGDPGAGACSPCKKMKASILERLWAIPAI